MYQRIEHGENVIDFSIKYFDSLFQKQLKDSGIITYNGLQVVHVIHRIDEFINKRKRNHGSIRTMKQRK